MIECVKCAHNIDETELKNRLYVCPACNYHFRLSAKDRLAFTVDPNSFDEFDKDAVGNNPLDFPDYDEKLKATAQKLGLSEAVITGRGRIGGHDCVLCAMDGRFLMGSMGMAVGEKITRAFEFATDEKLPVVVFSVSGGARMQEGIVSLMQMAKTSGAVKRHNDKGLLFISVLTDPTTGGVLASFAGLGDIILSEPRAYIGFAGKRVIENTLGQTLPKGFQSGEFFREHGFIDKIVERKDLRSLLSSLLKLHEGGEG